MRLRSLAAAVPLLLVSQCEPQCADPAGTDGPQFAQYIADGTGTPGNCESYADDMAAAGLPVATFKAIAWRESGCRPSAWVVDHDDNGGGLFGFNFIGSMAGYWRNLCGATTSNIRGNVGMQMKCASAEYRAHGLRAWRT